MNPPNTSTQPEPTEADRELSKKLLEHCNWDLREVADWHEWYSKAIAQHVAACVARETARVKAFSATEACAEIPALAEYVAALDNDLRIVTADLNGVMAINERHRTELVTTRETLQRGLDRDWDDTTTPHLAVVATNALASSRAEVARLREALTSGPWPMTDVIAKLCDAVRHLRDKHNCDTHLHEQFWIALQFAEIGLVELSAALSPAPAEVETGPTLLPVDSAAKTGGSSGEVNKRTGSPSDGVAVEGVDIAAGHPVPLAPRADEGTPTPRTDAQTTYWLGNTPHSDGRIECVDKAFARELERELAKANAELADLRRDRERLDRAIRVLRVLRDERKGAGFHTDISDEIIADYYAARSPLPCADINQSTSDYVLSVEDLPSYSLAPLVGRKEEEKT